MAHRVFQIQAHCTRKEAVLGGYTYTCGTTLAHLQLTGRLADVCVRVLNC